MKNLKIKGAVYPGLFRRNPKYVPLQYQAPSFVKTHKVAPKEPTAEDRMPWRMFDHFGPYLCKRCGHTVDEVFIVAKTRALADEQFRKKMNGLSAGCMANVLLEPHHVVRTLDGGPANPLNVFRIIGRHYNQPVKCDCGKDRQFYFVLVPLAEANIMAKVEQLFKDYRMCAVCLCETLCLDRYALETIGGAAP